MTEYELYQLLENNGYEPSKENLDILCEGVENGSILILNEKDSVTKHNDANQEILTSLSTSPSEKEKAVKSQKEINAWNREHGNVITQAPKKKREIRENERHKHEQYELTSLGKKDPITGKYVIRKDSISNSNPEGIFPGDQRFHEVYKNFNNMR